MITNIKDCSFSNNRLNAIRKANGFEVLAMDGNIELPSIGEFPHVVQAIYNSLFTDKPVYYDRKELLSLVFVKQDPYLLGKMRELLQLTLLKLFDQLKPELGYEFLVGHILSYLPFFDVQDGEVFKVPLSINGKWKLICYEAHRLILTPRALGSPVSAIGLTAQNATHLLLFKGTSYPSDEGFMLGLLTDLNPGASVGTYLFYLGKEKIKSWLGSNNVKVYGLSLGGTMALHTAVAFPSNIEAVYAFNPSALFPNDLINYKGSENVHVICNENDAVPASGFCWGKNWNLYRLFLEKKIPFLLAHFKCFQTRKSFLILKINKEMDEQKWSRRLIGYSHLIASLLLFPLGVLVWLYQNILNQFKDFFKRS